MPRAMQLRGPQQPACRFDQVLPPGSKRLRAEAIFNLQSGSAFAVGLARGTVGVPLQLIMTGVVSTRRPATLLVTCVRGLSTYMEAQFKAPLSLAPTCFVAARRRVPEASCVA